MFEYIVALKGNLHLYEENISQSVLIIERKESIIMLRTKPALEKKGTSKHWWILLAILLLVVILLLPTPTSLPVAGHRALAILAFAVVLWVTEAVAYPVSAMFILSLIAILLGLGPSLSDANTSMGTLAALNLALGGFSSSAVALVAGALFLAAAMQQTGLDKRIALLILSRVGSRIKGILLGAILVGIVLAFFIPSTTARVGAIIPIMLGMVSAFGLTNKSQLAALLIITSAQIASIWNIGIKTAAAQNMVAIGFLEKTLNYTISWGEWFLYAAPWAILMSILLYFVMLKVIPPEVEEIPRGQEMIRKQLADLGPVAPAEKRLMVISILLLFFWATEKNLHPLDSTTVTLIAVAVMLAPKIGVFTWREAASKIPWGTIILFAVGISLGTVLLKTKAASWLANTFFSSIGLPYMPLIAIIAFLSLFNIIIHLGFASATSLSATLIPVVIALVQNLNLPGVSEPGIVLIQQFVVSFGFLLPVSAPQNMLAYGTDTFTTKDFIKSGVPLTVIGFLLVLLFSVTYWRWMGLI